MCVFKCASCCYAHSLYYDVCSTSLVLFLHEVQLCTFCGSPLWLSIYAGALHGVSGLTYCIRVLHCSCHHFLCLASCIQSLIVSRYFCLPVFYNTTNVYYIANVYKYLQILSMCIDSRCFQFACKSSSFDYDLDTAMIAKVCAFCHK